MSFAKFLYDWNKSIAEEELIIRFSDHKDPIIRISNFVEKISSIWNQEDFQKEFIQTYIIKSENIPYSTYKLEQDILFEQGHGKIPITKEFITKKNSQIIEDQFNSLQAWLDYLTCLDANYPI